MPPKKAPRPAQENISLGPQVREGEFCRSTTKTSWRKATFTDVPRVPQASLSLALPVSSPLSTTPSSMSLISGSSKPILEKITFNPTTGFTSE